MFSLKRTALALRAFIAELPLGHYLFGAVAAAVICVIITLITGDSNIIRDSVILKEYTFMPTSGVIGIIATAGGLTASLLGLHWTTTELKEENRRVRLLALPVSQSERTTAVLLMNWLYLPLIAIVPAFLTVILYLSLQGGYVMTPAASALWPAIPITWFSVLLTSALYLFPAIALPRRVVVTTVALILFIGFYLALTREDYNDSIDILHTTASFDAKDVVGMHYQNALYETDSPSEFRYNLPDRFGWPGVLAVLSLLLLCAATVVGLHRKTA